MTHAEAAFAFASATGTKGLALGIAAHLDRLSSEARASIIFYGLGARVVAGPEFQVQ